MWANSRKIKNGASITTLIAQGTVIRGNVGFTGGLHVDGRIDALTYEDAPEARGGGLFSRLFG